MPKGNVISVKDLPLVAIDMGSDCMRAMAAQCTPEGELRILGVETNARMSYIERGVITNATNAGFMISEVLKLLANRIRSPKIDSAFVSLGGKSMTVTEVVAKRDQIRKREVTRQLLDDMEKECHNKIEQSRPDVAVLDLIPAYYVLDGIEQDHVPTANQKAIKVEVHFDAFVGKKELLQKVSDSFLRTTIQPEHAFVRSDALMNALASDEDFRSGCAFLDMGAETTTLTIFKNNRYIKSKVIPYGGRDITGDIAQQGISNASAEKLKCEYGYASPVMVEKNYRFRIPSEAIPGGELVMMADEMAQIISERLDQILDPLMEIINQQASDINTLYVTGGASMLQGLDAYVQSKTQVPVLYGSHAAWLTADTPDEYCQPTYSALVGTLLLGAAYREAHPVTRQKKKDKLMTQIVEKTLEIFGNDSY